MIRRAAAAFAGLLLVALVLVACTGSSGPSAQERAARIQTVLAAPDARERLLALPQVGPESADTLLAFTGTSVPVVDAYLRRVLGRLGLVDPAAPYALLRERLAAQDTGGVSWDVLHALVVEHGIHHCLTGRPRQEGDRRRSWWREQGL